MPNVAINRLTRYEFLQTLKNNFWKRWSSEYLSTLQNKTKWKSSSPNILVGKLVLIKNENSVPCKWPLARVVEVHPDSEGNVRVVTVRTSNGKFKRAITKICPVPIEPKTDDQLSTEIEECDVVKD